MPLVNRFSSVLSHVSSALSHGVARRFATKATRFRLAVTAGLVISAIGYLTFIAGNGSGFADVMWGSMSFFGDAPAARQQAAETPAASSGWGRWFGARRHAAHHHVVAKVEPARYHRDHEQHDHVAKVASGDAPMELGRKSMCVRLCDGFAFPVGLYHGEQDRALHEATCHSECPGAATALYVEPSGADSIDDAIRVGTDKSYSELPYAFHYTTVLSDACSCHPPAGSRLTSLLRDFTLRRGDAVMTTAGFQVFHGGARYPYRKNDFVALARSRDVRKSDQSALHAIERASLVSQPSVIAQQPAPAPPARDARTKPLEHDASLTTP